FRYSSGPSNLTPIQSESGDTTNASLERHCLVTSWKLGQSTPRITRRTVSVFAVLDHSTGERHEATRRSRKRSTSERENSDWFPSGASSPSRNARPISPPNFARKSVDRLPSTGGTSIPPEIVSHARQPIFGWSIANSSPASSTHAWPAGKGVDPERMSKSPPHHAITRLSWR